MLHHEAFLSSIAIINQSEVIGWLNECGDYWFDVFSFVLFEFFFILFPPCINCKVVRTENKAAEVKMINGVAAPTTTANIFT